MCQKMEIIRPSTARVRPSIDYTSIRKINPGLNQVTQGMNGLMSVIVLPATGPVRTGITRLKAGGISAGA